MRSMICHFVLDLSWNKHFIFKAKDQDGTSVYYQAELAICDLLHNPQKLELFQSIQVLFFDKVGQVSDEKFAVLDIIFHCVKYFFKIWDLLSTEPPSKNIINKEVIGRIIAIPDYFQESSKSPRSDQFFFLSGLDFYKSIF